MKSAKRSRSVAVQLAIKFTMIHTAAILLLSVAFTAILSFFSRRQQSNEIRQAARVIESSLQHNRENDLRLPALPYYITYLIYSDSKKSILSTNDPFLPVLPETNGKTKYFSSKNYFIDGDLNILYYTIKFTNRTDSYIIQTSLNMDLNTNLSLISLLPKTISVALIPIMIVSFFISLLLTRYSLSPVSKITKAAKEIGSTNLDILLPRNHSGDELDQLAKTFNQLFKRLKKDFDRERQFTSDVSHELKTPVAVILGQANMLRRWGKDEPEQLEKSLTAIINESRSMEAVITNLLQMGRLESGRILPKKEAVDILEMLHRLEVETQSIKPGTVFEYDHNIKSVIMADTELLHQVFTVIISNSLKFIPENTVIRIRYAAYDSRHHICIEDNGPGFPPDAIEHVFERFYRCDTAHTRSVGGSGLGLSIAQTIIYAMHGQISAYNAVPCGAGIKISL